MIIGQCWPRVLRCRWCGVPVLRDNHGDWIHHHLAYVCRDATGGVLPTNAEPALATVDQPVRREQR